MNRAISLMCCLVPMGAMGGVIINEIHYNSEPNSLRSEFVELFNDGGAAVDISGWRFADGIDYVIPAGTILPGGGYLSVVEDRGDFGLAYGGAGGAQVIAHWSFDESSGTTAADASGTPNGAGETKTAVASGGVSLAAEGRFGGSGVSIDGAAGSYLTIPHLDALWGGSYTVAAWVKPADTAVNTILSDFSTPQSFMFSVDTAARMTHRYNAVMPNTSPAWNGSGGTITAGIWQHVAAVWDREAQVGKIFLNGVMVYRGVIGRMPAELAMVQNARPWHIGRKQDNNDTFNGLLDELWVIRGAMTGAGVATLMNENRLVGTQVVDLADLVAGGTGSRPGTSSEIGINAATGEILPGLGAGTHAPAAAGGYYPVANPAIDGVFVPNGTLTAGQPVTTTGITAVIGSGDADPTVGYWFNGGGLLGDPSKVNSTATHYLPKYLDEPLSHSVLSAMTQKGITFDLAAIEAAHGGRQAVAFTAVAGDSRMQTGGSVAALVLVDGVERFRQTNIVNNEHVIDVPLPADARFLTLVTTNSDGNNANDHGFF
ncbi:MAG: LamG-like jellyroll fold domain-containing protein, partial [Verrucomicrobiales bacterium]